MNVFKLIEDNGLTLHGDIEHFAELIRQEEREACARVCEEDVRDEYIRQDRPAQDEAFLFAAIADCAEAIRARGEQ